MEPRKGYLCRTAFFVFEMWLATVFALLILFALASIGGSLDILKKSYYNEIGVASLRDSIISQDSAESEFADLAQLLPKVATDERTVIMTSVNEAFARPNSLLAVFRESFQVGEEIGHLLNNVLVVAVDAKAFSYCKAVHPHCYLLEVKTMNLSSASNYMSEAYIEIVWAKLSLQQRVLELGYNFLFTDVDIVWFRNPFRHINVFADMTTSSDVFYGDVDSLDNWPNTGFFHVKATNKTVEMLRRWRAARERFPPDHEQNIFREIKHELARDLGARIQFLDAKRFGSFCRIFHTDMAAAFTMHANCCVGLGDKLRDLRDVLDQWKNYSGLTPQEKKRQKFMWKCPAKCGSRDKMKGQAYESEKCTETTTASRNQPS